MRTLKDEDRIKIVGRGFRRAERTYYGTIGTLRDAWEKSDYFRSRWPEYGDDFLADMFRRQNGDRYEAYAIQGALIICNDPGYYERKRAEEATATLIADGEVFEISGVPMRAKFIGDYSAIVHFYRV